MTNQIDIKTVNSLLDQAIKLSDPKTVRFLKRAQTAIKEGHPDKATTEIIKAFDGLSDTDQMGNLNQSQLKSIEQMISRLYRQPQSTNQKVQSEIDRLLNRSYQSAQRKSSSSRGTDLSKGQTRRGSQLSYLYLLMALDRAEIPIENTPKHFQKQVKTWLNSINKDVVQIGGALPVVSSLPTLSVSPLAYVVSGLGLGLVSILLIIVLFINRRCQESLKQKTEREMQPLWVAQTYAGTPQTPYGAPPEIYGQVAPNVQEETYGLLPKTDMPVDVQGMVSQEYGSVEQYGVEPSSHVYSTMPLGNEGTP